MTNTTESKKLLFSTGLLPLVSVGMYGTVLSPEEVLENELYVLNSDENDKYWCELFSDELYNEMILDNAKDVVNDIVLPDLLKLGVGIQSIDNYSIHSPRQYNFETDQLYYDINVVEDFNVVLINKLKEQNQEELAKFLKDNYSSYSGFMSFTSNNIEDLFDGINDWKDQDIAAGLTFLIKDNIKDYQYTLEEKVYENRSATAYIKDRRKGKKIINKIING
jgi:hypothetical protein